MNNLYLLGAGWDNINSIDDPIPLNNCKSSATPPPYCACCCVDAVPELPFSNEDSQDYSKYLVVIVIVAAVAVVSVMLKKK
jgi:hypothetical protein